MSIKERIRGSIRAAAKNAPWGVRQALFEGVAEREGKARLMAKLARDCHIDGFITHGDMGFMQAASTDETLLPTYGRTKTWAAPTVAHLREALSDGGTYLDIGANVGLTTVPIAKDERVQCIAFEPDPTNFLHLSHNIRRNCPFGNVETVQAAVMDKPGVLTFGLSDEGNPGDHRVVKGETSRKVIEVQGITLDQHLPKITGPLAVKIDTQGAEPFVISGGRQILSQARAVVMEFWPFGMSRMGGDPSTIFDFVRQFKHVELADGERDQKRHLDDAVAELRHLFNSGREDLYQYWDLYLAR